MTWHCYYADVVTSSDTYKEPHTNTNDATRSSIYVNHAYHSKGDISTTPSTPTTLSTPSERTTIPAYIMTRGELDTSVTNVQHTHTTTTTTSGSSSSGSSVYASTVDMQEFDRLTTREQITRIEGKVFTTCEDYKWPCKYECGY